MYINFQQNRVKTQVITVLTSIFAKNRKFHKFATVIILKIHPFTQASSENVRAYQFSAKSG